MSPAREPEKIEIYPSRRELLISLAVVVGLGGPGSLSLMGTFGEVDLLNLPDSLDPVLVVIGWVLLVMCALAVPYLLKRIVAPKPWVVLSNEGLYAVTPWTGTSLSPWPCVKAATIVDSPKKGNVWVDIESPPPASDQEPDAEPEQHAILIPVPDLATTPDQLLDHIEHFRTTYGEHRP